MGYDEAMNPKVNQSAVDLARSIAADVAPRADRADRDGCLPTDDAALLKQSGYLGLAVPSEFGGWGEPLLTCVAAQLELAKGSTSTALVASLHHQVVGHQRETTTWRPDARLQIMSELVKGSIINHLASEPRLGSPSRGGLPETTATPTANEESLAINGHKTWSTGGRHLTHMLVRVVIGDEKGVVLVRQPAGGVTGLEWIETWKESMSLRASDSHDAVFQDVVVPRENLIEVGGVKSIPNVWFPTMISSIYLGTAIAARDAVIRYALERVPTALGKPIATLPKIQRQIGEIDVALMAAKALLFDVAASWTGKEEDRERIMPRIAAAKVAVSVAANEVTEKALRVAGGSGITRALPLERYFRDVRASDMQPPSGDTAYEMVGRSALRL
jgi:alkylation response protein AidB-like acyl-CoA dehydrogenase